MYAESLALQTFFPSDNVSDTEDFEEIDMETKLRRHSDSASDLVADARIGIPAWAQTLVARFTWLVCRKAGQPRCERERHPLACDSLATLDRI